MTDVCVEKASIKETLSKEESSALAYRSRFLSPMRFQNPELDDFLEKGTQLYYSICIHGGYLLLTEIPHRISFPDDVFSDETKDPLTGMINMSSDNSEALIFTVESALRNGFMTLTSCF